MKRKSVASVISILFLSLVILFMLSTALSYYRLVEFQSILSRITKTSLPEIIYSGKIYNQINELAFLTAGLTNASSQAAQRIAFNNIQDKIASIQANIRTDKINNSLENQLDVIVNETKSLNKLVGQKILLDKNTRKKAAVLYQLHKKLLFLFTQNKKTNVEDLYHWQQTYSELIVFTTQVLRSSKLQEVRQISKVAEQDLIVLKKWLQTYKSSQPELINLIDKISTILITNDGIFKLRTEQLRISGRVRGRGNFVKNISDDFARVVEYQLYETNKTILKDTQKASSRLATQIKIIAVISLFVLLLLFFVIYFIRTHFVKRLMTLNNKVIARISGKEVSLNIKGNDELSEIASSFNYFASKIEEQKEILHQLSLTDGLTGIANRRSMDERLDHELSLAKRTKTPFSILLMDIDFFKSYNDNYGHLAGDECLKKVVSCLLACKQRDSDFVARYGGEEFLFVLPDTNSQGAEKVAQHILDVINGSKIVHLHSKTVPHVTLSIGITTFKCSENNSIDNLLKRVDKALYQAKNNGKNCFYTL
ncbi:MAG: hypothetical protein COB35_12815 [Gammaproteobacteria bacterium]|nr:MAG: hypothetical protein COB35_12815 [Gammaproteobacteria bacterium]